jgi:hypothetical protein
LIMTKQASSPIVDMLYNLELDPYETKNLLGSNKGGLPDLEVIGKAEHLKALLIEWMTRMDGPERLYSDRRFNLNEGRGDIEEVKNRRTWGKVRYWESDMELNFGPLAKLSKDSFTRHEYFYVGKSDPSGKPLRISNIRVAGRDSSYFSVDRTEGEVVAGYLRIRVTLTSPKGDLASIKASLEFQTSSDGSRVIPIVLE